MFHGWLHQDVVYTRHRQSCSVLAKSQIPEPVFDYAAWGDNYKLLKTRAVMPDANRNLSRLVLDTIRLYSISTQTVCIHTCGTWMQPVDLCLTESRLPRPLPSRCLQSHPVSVEGNTTVSYFTTIIETVDCYWLLPAKQLSPLALTLCQTTSCPCLWSWPLHSCVQILVFDPCGRKQKYNKKLRNDVWK